MDRLAAEDITEKVVASFLDYVERHRGCSVSTRNARLAAIHSLFAFIAREEPVLLPQCQRIRAIPLKRTSHETVDYLEEKEMQAILDAVDINSRTGIRDRALLLLLYNTGARVSEIVVLKVSDLRPSEAGQVHLLGKGKKHRTCPLWPETVTARQDYLRRLTPQEPGIEQFFLNANGASITRFGIRHVVCKYGAVAQRNCPSSKAKTVTPHTIRHYRHAHLLRAGNDVNMVSYWLGHTDINTTHIYLEIDMEMKRKMLEKAVAPTIKKDKPWRHPDILKWLNNLAKERKLCEVNY